LKIWDAETGEILYSIANENENGWNPFHIKIAPDGRSIATSTVLGGINIWEIIYQGDSHSAQ
jgi:hypothetical protein